MTQQRVSPITVTSLLPATVTLSLQGALGQSANLVEVKNSSGSVLANISTTGNIETISGMRFYTSSARSGWSTLTNSSGDLSFNYKFTFTGGLQSNAASASTVGAIIKGAASQTANLQEWQNSAGTVVASIQSNGKIIGTSDLLINSGVAYFNAAGDTNGTFISVASGRGNFVLQLANSVGLTVKAAASQTANLQEWQDSAGTIKAYVRNDGLVQSSTGILSSSTFICANGYITGATLTSTATSATSIGLLVRGAASQSADLQQWQNSSATVLAKVDATGNIVVGNMAIATSSVATIHISNGTIPSANPTGGGVLYVEGGALKYRGSSGTITTIANA